MQKYRRMVITRHILCLINQSPSALNRKPEKNRHKYGRLLRKLDCWKSKCNTCACSTKCTECNYFLGFDGSGACVIEEWCCENLPISNMTGLPWGKKRKPTYCRNWVPKRPRMAVISVFAGMVERLSKDENISKTLESSLCKVRQSKENTFSFVTECWMESSM